MRKIISTLFLSTALILGAHAQKKTTFKLNPTKGQEIPYEMLIKSDIQGPQNMIMDMSMKMSMTATDVTAEEIKYNAKYSQVKADINAGIMTIAYDSSKEPANQMEEMMASQLKPILENTLTITMDKSAKVIDMQFPNVSEQAFDKSSIQGMSATLPTNPVAIGETWEVDTDLPKLNAKSKTINTYAEKTAEGHKINVTGTYTDAEGKTVGTSTGYYILDPVTFFTKASSVETKMEVQGAKIVSTVELKEVK